jgi:hypothetical protein
MEINVFFTGVLWCSHLLVAMVHGVYVVLMLLCPVYFLISCVALIPSFYVPMYFLGSCNGKSLFNELRLRVRFVRLSCLIVLPSIS